MKIYIFFLVILSSFGFCETGNQVGMADMKEAIARLIVETRNVAAQVDRGRVVYEKVPLEKNYLDPYIADFVKRNKNTLPTINQY